MNTIKQAIILMEKFNPYHCLYTTINEIWDKFRVRTLHSANVKIKVGVSVRVIRVRVIRVMVKGTSLGGAQVKLSPISSIYLPKNQ